MKRPNEEILRAIISFENDPRGLLIFGWFQESLEEAHKALYENTVFNAGRVGELSDLVRNFVEARKNLENLLKNRA